MYYFLFIGVIANVFVYIKCKDIAIKIVEEPASFGYPGIHQDVNSENEIQMRVEPSQFSGPKHLKSLDGKCFSKIDEDYKYEFCPFSNVTQHEQSFRWNPYNGVLGVWQEWEITNNTFSAMMFAEGDSCGSKFRSVKVLLHCDENNELEKVSEPETCMYEMVFKTPFVCHPHAMLVYPTLNESLRHDWDVLEGEYANEELTDKGYKQELNVIFKKAGYKLTTASKVASKLQENTDNNTANEHGQTNLLEENKKLQEEIEKLKTMLAVYQSSNSTVGN